jgi:membrane protease YdiL (CAAX protease family)
MAARVEATPVDHSPPRSWPTVLALGFAMTFPTLVAWLYFIALAEGRGGQPNRSQQLTYSIGKVIQFAFPAVFLLLHDRRWPSWPAPRRSGLLLGLGFGLVVGAGMLAVYFGWLRSSSMLERTPVQIRHKLEEFGLASPLGYLGLAAFLAVGHSLLEEYYWRWFVFGRLRNLVPPSVALVLASLAFMSHHVIVLWVYLPGKVLAGVVPGSLAIALGGGVWAWIYQRSGSLAGPWLSHLLVDAAMFVIGWDLLHRATS